MGTAHTPGDWRVDGSFRVTVNAVQPDGSFCTIVACPGASRGAPVAETVANARLIAAAPDLLEAVHNARNLFGLVIGCLPTVPASGEGCGMSLADMARTHDAIFAEAIAKAEDWS